MNQQKQAALEILRRAQNPFVPGSAEHWALEVLCREEGKAQKRGESV